MRIQITDRAVGDVRHLADAVRNSQPRCGTTRVVAIDGRSGSGKTTLADELATELQLAQSQIVRLDAFYPGWDGLAQGIDILTRQILEPLAAGERAAYRRWDWSRDAWGAEIEVPATDLLLVEGCGCATPPAAPYLAVSVWLEVAAECRRHRALTRDGTMFAPHWDRWRTQEDVVFGTSDHPGV